MEKYSTAFEERLFDLIESKAYSELTLKEKDFVDQHISESEYGAHRIIKKNAALAFADDENVIPLPLSLPTRKSNALFTKSIPLYQVLLVAAVIVIVFLIIPPATNQNTSSKTEYIVQHDTVEIEKLIHDTITHVKERIVPVEKIVYVNSAPITLTKETELRLLESGISIDLPPIEKSDLQNKGNSMNEERTAGLIKNYLQLNP